MTDQDIHQTATWYRSKCPETDLLAFETHMSLLRLNADLDVSNDKLGKGGQLSRTRLNVLRLLLQTEHERLSLTELSEGLNVTHTNITRLVDDLMSAGLIRRERDPDDKRRTWAILTEDGRRTFEQELPALARRTATLWSGLDDHDKRVLIHLISKARLHLSTAAAGDRVSYYGSVGTPTEAREMRMVLRLDSEDVAVLEPARTARQERGALSRQRRTTVEKPGVAETEASNDE